MSLRDRIEYRAMRLAEDARELRMMAGFDIYAASGRPGIETMTDADLERALRTVTFVRDEIEKTIAAKAAAQQPVMEGVI